MTATSALELLHHNCDFREFSICDNLGLAFPQDVHISSNLNSGLDTHSFAVLHITQTTFSLHFGAQFYFTSAAASISFASLSVIIEVSTPSLLFYMHRSMVKNHLVTSSFFSFFFPYAFGASSSFIL